MRNACQNKYLYISNRAILLLFIMISGLVPQPARGARTARAEQPFIFPNAHYPHALAGIEWWYYTGILDDETGTQYGYFFTLFKQHSMLHAVFRLTDVQTGSAIRKDMVALKKIGNPSELNIRLTNNFIERSAVLQYDEETDIFRFTIADRDLHIDLKLHPIKPYVLHGTNGYIMQSTAGPSAYYSAPAMAAEGQLTVRGMATNVSGDGWMDHQWGNWAFNPAAYRYDWFSCRFDDNTQLMLYHFRDADGSTLDDYLTGTYVDAEGEKQLITDFIVDPLDHTWQAPHTNQIFPLQWRIMVPAVDLDFTTDTDIENQYIYALLSDSGYWEGITYVTDTHTNRTGYCYLEMSNRPAPSDQGSASNEY